MSKLTSKAVLLGGAGIGLLAYSYLRKPRYLFDGEVIACEGSSEGENCTVLYLGRGARSGKIFAPFPGKVVVATKNSSESSVVLHTNLGSLSLSLEGARSIPPLSVKVTAGQLLGQAERVRVSAFIQETSGMRPMSPSSLLLANGLRPASLPTDKWCEDLSQIVVPPCKGVTYAAPQLPGMSLRSFRMTFQ